MIQLSTKLESPQIIGSHTNNPSDLVSDAGAISIITPINAAIFMPVYISGNVTLTRAQWYNMVTVNGNMDVGLYTLDGTRLASTGAVAQSGADASQTAALTAPIHVRRGVYYMAYSSSSGTSTLNGVSYVGAVADMLALLGCARMAAAHPLPATATLVTIIGAGYGGAGTTMPCILLTSRSFA